MGDRRSTIRNQFFSKLHNLVDSSPSFNLLNFEEGESRSFPKNHFPYGMLDKFINSVALEKYEGFMWK
jgi:hypothetical protein